VAFQLQLGLHAGYAWGRADDNRSRLFPVPGSSADRLDLRGFVGGAHAGYNYQVGQFVQGGEVDLDATGVGGSSRFSSEGGAVAGVPRLRSDVQGSARLRAGYAIDDVLLYATGGVAVADGKLTAGASATRAPILAGRLVPAPNMPSRRVGSAGPNSASAISRRTATRRRMGP
jgi:outer membrane immunogenic protein